MKRNMVCYNIIERIVLKQLVYTCLGVDLKGDLKGMITEKNNSKRKKRIQRQTALLPLLFYFT